MGRISYTEYLEKLRDPSLTDEDLLPFILISPGDGGFDFVVSPNPETVELSEEDIEFENALAIANNIDRYRRRLKFKQGLASNPERKLLVTEGDSWMLFPLIVTDIVDYLGAKYNISSLGAAGDTLKNITKGPKRPRGCEYLTELLKHKDRVDGFILSAAGNDIIGEDPDTGVIALEQLTCNFNGDVTDVEGHINQQQLKIQIAKIRDAYKEVIANIRNVPEFKNLPIVFHGYDYPFPYPVGDNDPRHPIHVRPTDKWLGSVLNKRKIHDPQLRRAILIYLIDRLYEVLFSIAGDSQKTGIWIVDCRGSMPDVSLWIDEIHGTSKGFASVSARFFGVLNQAIPSDVLQNA